MMEFLKDFVADKSHQVEELFRSIDLEKLSAEGKAKIHQLFQELPPESKYKTLHWIQEVQDIKDSTMRKRDKYRHMENLDTGDVIVSLFRSLLTILVDEIPIKNKHLLMTGLIGAGTLFTAFRARTAFIAGLVATKGFPAFLMSPASDKILEHLKAQLSDKSH